jgi:hypothetical protein
VDSQEAAWLRAKLTWLEDQLRVSQQDEAALLADNQVLSSQLAAVELELSSSDEELTRCRSELDASYCLMLELATAHAQLAEARSRNGWLLQM